MEINNSSRATFLVASNILYSLFADSKSLYIQSINFFTSCSCKVFGNLFSCLNLNLSFLNGLIDIKLLSSKKL